MDTLDDDSQDLLFELMHALESVEALGKPPGLLDQVLSKMYHALKERTQLLDS